MITRRGILGTLLAAPVIIRTPGLLMRVKPPVDVAYGYHFKEMSLGYSIDAKLLRDLLLPGLRSISGEYSQLTNKSMWQSVFDEANGT